MIDSNTIAAIVGALAIVGVALYLFKRSSKGDQAAAPKGPAKSHPLDGEEQGS